MAKQGFNCVLKVGTQAIGKARDVELSSNAGTVDVTSRGSGGWKEFLPGLKEWDASVQQVYVLEDLGVKALSDAYFDGTVIACEFRESANGAGFGGNAIVTGFKRPEPIEGAVMMDITLKGTGPLNELAAS